ncbi:hypothetical protein UP09_08370 [Bradyrhizobium sp. LTSP885]|nr:hypothetical protein UP09_08370 [Bradyrhizobium sp. LTSP885]
MSQQTARTQIAAEVIIVRIRRVEAWRRARFRRMVNELDGDATRARIMRAARLNLEVHVRRQAIERGVTE